MVRGRKRKQVGKIRRHETTEKVKTGGDEMIDGQQNHEADTIKEETEGGIRGEKKMCQGSEKTDEKEKGSDRKAQQVQVDLICLEEKK